MLPPFARQACLQAAHLAPIQSFTSVPSVDPATISTSAAGILFTSRSGADPWPLSRMALVDQLTALPNLADRAALVEALGHVGIGPCQYSDDLTAACPSPGAARAVLAPEPGSACTAYAMRARARFNYKPGKTAAMAVLGSPDLDPEVIGCDVPSTYPLLGVLLDQGLSFSPLLLQTLAIGWAAFIQLHHAAETGGFRSQSPRHRCLCVLNLESCLQVPCLSSLHVHSRS